MLSFTLLLPLREAWLPYCELLHRKAHVARSWQIQPTARKDMRTANSGKHDFGNGDTCSPSWHLNCSLAKGSEPDTFNQATSELLIHRNSETVNVVSSCKFGLLVTQWQIANTSTVTDLIESLENSLGKCLQEFFPSFTFLLSAVSVTYSQLSLETNDALSVITAGQ